MNVDAPENRVEYPSVERSGIPLSPLRGVDVGHSCEQTDSDPARRRATLRLRHSGAASRCRRLGSAPDPIEQSAAWNRAYRSYARLRRALHQDQTIVAEVRGSRRRGATGPHAYAEMCLGARFRAMAATSVVFLTTPQARDPASSGSPGASFGSSSKAGLR